MFIPKTTSRIAKTGGRLCFIGPHRTREKDGCGTRLRQFETYGIAEPHTADDVQQQGARCKVCLYKIPA